MQININDEALSDLKDIKEYISQDDQITAEKLIDNILDIIESLKDFANSGFKLDKYTKRKNNYRVKVVKPYLIFYKQEQNCINIYRVLHGARNYLKLLEL